MASRHFPNRPSFYKRVGPELARRDGGYKCAYCGVALVPPGVARTDPAYYQPSNQAHYDPHLRKRVYTELKAGFAQGTVDHVLAQECGGSDALDNLVLACKTCNTVKKHHPVEAFKERGQ